MEVRSLPNDVAVLYYIWEKLLIRKIFSYEIAPAIFAELLVKLELSRLI